MHTATKLTQTVLTLMLVLAGAPAHSIVSYYTDFANFDAASTATLVEDFEAVGPTNVALPSLNSNGITYAPVSPATNVWVATPPYFNFGLPGGTTSTVLTATGPERFTITPDSPLSAIGFDTYTNSAAPAIVSVFGTLGLLGTFDLTSLPSNVVGFLGITSTDAITSVEWSTTGGESVNTGIDNVYTQQVPEPSVLLLIASAFFAFRLSRRA
jgi:hypothetical protein